MKNLYKISTGLTRFIMGILVISSVNSLAQCPEFVAQFYSQAEVDSFTIKYPYCKELNSGIVIGPSEDISDLKPLSGIVVKYSIRVIENRVLKNLEGLESAENIFRLEILNNPLLDDISIIQEIEFSTIGDSPRVSIAYNRSLNACCLTVSPPLTCVFDGVSNNGPECISKEQVVLACTPQQNYACDIPDRPYNNDTLKANNVKAMLSSNGGLFYDYTGLSTYEVPVGSSTNSLFLANLWMGGIDEGGDLRVAAQTYNQGGRDFWPGPIVENYEYCNEFDRVWSISKATIDTFVSRYIEAQGSLVKGSIPKSILEYPATNNPHFNEFPLPKDVNLAPFVDTNKDGNYDPLDGDYPAIRGDQNNWNIFNDVRFYGREQGCNYPLNMQISCMAYASASKDYINNATFYDYTLTYKGNDTLKDFYLGIFVDPDLGNFDDDFVGCSIDGKMGYAYNGDDFDESVAGYGEEIPTIGIKFIKSLINEDNQEMPLSAFVSYENNFTEVGNVGNAEATYNYLKGIWQDNTPLTFGANGYGGDTPFPYMYPDSPNDENGWSEYTTGNEPADRRFVMSVGPITFSPGEVQTVTIGILWHPNVGGGNPDLSPLFEISKQVETDIDSLFALPCNGNIIWYEDLDGDGLGNSQITKYACEQPLGFAAAMDSLTTDIQTNALVKLIVTPNPASHFINVSFGKKLDKFNKMKIYNSLGQLVYQNKMSANQNQVKLNVSDFGNGLYYLEVGDDANVRSQASFIIQ